MRILLLPGIECGLTHPEVATDVPHGGAGFALAKGIDDLLFREFGPLHQAPPFVSDHQRTILLQFYSVVEFGGDVRS